MLVAKAQRGNRPHYIPCSCGFRLETNMNPCLIFLYLWYIKTTIFLFGVDHWTSTVGTRRRNSAGSRWFPRGFISSTTAPWIWRPRAPRLGQGGETVGAQDVGHGGVHRGRGWGGIWGAPTHIATPNRLVQQSLSVTNQRPFPPRACMGGVASTRFLGLNYQCKCSNVALPGSLV